MNEFDLIWTDEEKQEAEKEAYNKALEDFRKRINGFLCDSEHFADFIVTDGAIDCVIDELKKEVE